MNRENHCFVIPAYGESPYLRSCIESLRSQTVQSEIVIATSTPSSFLTDIANEYHLPLFVRSGDPDIQDDWNFALACSKSRFVTIAHQDDVYKPTYAECVLKAIQENPDATIAFTDYIPFKHNNETNDINHDIKRWIRLKTMAGNHCRIFAWKKRMLSFGNTINCPSVTYNTEKTGTEIFQSDLRFALDWDTFYRLAEIPGSFVYIDKPLVCYRIHQETETANWIRDDSRFRDDLAMFQKLHNPVVAKFIMLFYPLAYKTYNVRKKK